MRLTDKKWLMKANLTIWEDSIVECIFTDKTDLSLRLVRTIFREAKNLSKGRKVNFILDCNNIKNIDWVSQSRLVDKMESQFKAIALVSDNTNSITIANVIVSISNPGFPITIAPSIDAARQWLSQYK